MKTVVTKNGSFAQGEVRLCVPICEADIDGIKQACERLDFGIDVVEWRMDYFQGTTKQEWLNALDVIRELCDGYMLLATWRTVREGGVRPCSTQEYVQINEMMLQSGKVDLIDFELFCGEETLTHLVDTAHQYDVKVVISNHDHQNTPDDESMMIRLQAMQRMGGDLVKLAVMPNDVQDVYRLLQVSSAYVTKADSCLAITMAMGKCGFISRLCGEMSGSVMSFAALTKTSAPGQVDWQTMRMLLDQFHNAYAKDDGVK